MLKQRNQRREKLFGDGKPLPLDRNAKARIMVLARTKLRRDAPGRHYGPVTAKCYAVLIALLYGHHNSRTGLCFPSYDTIAKQADCARSTVALAIKALEMAGILTWCNRLRRMRVPGPAGWRWRVLRTSNGYRFIDQPPASPAASIPQVSSKSDVQSGTTNQVQSLIEIAEKCEFRPTSTPLDAALARLHRALHQHQPISP